MIRYHVTLPQAQAHRAHVRMTVLDAPAGELLLAMPVWTPGSYLVRDFSRHVLDLTAQDERGAALAVSKLDKNTWRVATKTAGPVHVDYVLYGNERSVRTNHIDDRHAFLSPAATFLFVRGRQAEAHAVSISAPAGWEVFTGLPQDASTWLAADYDTLVDCPIEVGPHRVLSFVHEDVPFRIVLAGEGVLNEQALCDDVATIVDEVGRIFGQIPFSDYTFLFTLVDSGGGGLEHLNSSVCMVSRWALAKKKEYRDFLELVAHEYFHAWNVKRFRPAALGPFDYDRENYTRDLWVAEGITSYYDELSIVRARFVDKVQDYLDERAKAFQELAELPGARRMSLSRASHDAWIKYYRPDENSRNSSVSYYTKGALVALLLDLRLQRLTDGKVNLATLLREGWSRWTVDGQGFPEGALGQLASELSGSDLRPFFDDFVDGTAPLPLDQDLAFVGLRLKVEPVPAADRPLPLDEAGFALAPWLGLVTADDGGLCKITAVLEDSPAFQAGLNVDDLLLGVGGHRVNSATLQERLDLLGAKPLEVSFYRGQSLRRVTVTPAPKRLEKWSFAPVEQASAQQRAAFQAWTGWDWPWPDAP
ncbi:MAG: M61 family metallopeptidase [Planctomycetota bacterium]